jgi:polysaccharide deacetylase 2 family uncharacterized protein YibQ
VAQATPAASTTKRPVTYVTLGIFWAVVIGICAGGGLILQLLGPVSKQAASPAPRHTRPESVSTSRPLLPAEPVGKVTPIAPPTDDLLEALSATDYPELPGAKLPKVGAGGTDWPARHYAAQVDPRDRQKHVALVVNGAGLDQELTLKLLRDVPAAVDIVFSAYMPPDRADSMAQAARETGHECLLSIPMEPSTAPMHDEGPHQLTADMSDDVYQQNLYWSLSRLGGCVGATGAADNGMRGERYAESPAFKNMLVEITKRGLLYLDPYTRTPALTPVTNASPELPVPGNIDLVRKMVLPPLDEPAPSGEPADEDQIRQNLDRLTGYASPDQPPIGLALNLNPKLIEIIRDWANTLPAKGVTLVPLSATPKMPPPPPLDVIPPPDQK